MIPGCQALAVTGGHALRTYGQNAAKTAVTAFYNQRAVTSQAARLFTSEGSDSCEQKSPDDREKFEIERLKRKIGRSGGLQNIVKLSYNPSLKIALGIPLSFALHIADVAADVISPAYSLAKTITGIYPYHPVSFALFAGVVAEIRYNQGYDRTTRAIPENSTLKEIRQESALQEACLKAQVRGVLDQSPIKYRIKYWMGAVEGEAGIPHFPEYGKIEYDSFNSLGLDFDSPLTIKDVIKAYEKKPEEHYAKIRLLGEYKE